MFILTANLVGQLPLKLIHLGHGELASPNNDINMTAAMALVVSIYYIYYGVKKNGFKFFFKGFSIDGIIITLVDTLELFVRPFSLTDLADYLSVDRSAMMREIGYLKDDKIIEKNGNSITLLY